MPLEEFISLERLGNWLHKRGYSQHYIFELLRKGELKAVIEHPEPLHPFRIPPVQWHKIDYAEFKLEEYSRDRRRRGVAFHIDDGFAYDWTVSHLQMLLRLVQAEDRALLDVPEIDVHVPGGIRRNAAPLPWAEIHSALVERLVSIMNQRVIRLLEQGCSRSRVFVLLSDFEDFKKQHQIKSQQVTAGRKRVAKKDNVWAEILKRYYTVYRKQITAKNRSSDIVTYAKRSLDYPISVAAVEDVLRVIDGLAVDISTD